MASLKLKLRPSSYFALVAWIAALVATIGLIALGASDTDDWGFLILIPLWLIAPYLATRDWVRAARKRRAAIVLGHVEEAVRLNLPLSQMMLAAADSESGRVRGRLLALHDGLEAGEPLGLALYTALPELSAASARAVLAADSISSLPHTLRRLSRRILPPDQYQPHLNRFYRGYAIFITIFGLTAIGGLVAMVALPKFVSILHSFGLPLPWTTQMFQAAANSWPLFAVFVGILLACCLPWSRAPADYLRRFVPVLGGAARDQALSDVFSFLADAVETGQTLDAALAEATDAQPNAVVRRKVRKMASAVAAGQTLSDAARRAGMPALVVGMLTVTSGPEMADVFSFLARHYEYRFSRARELIRAAAVPAFVFCMGAIVLFIDLSIFQPMIAMVNALAAPHHFHGVF